MLQLQLSMLLQLVENDAAVAVISVAAAGVNYAAGTVVSYAAIANVIAVTVISLVYLSTML